MGQTTLLPELWMIKAGYSITMEWKQEIHVKKSCTCRMCLFQSGGITVQAEQPAMLPMSFIMSNHQFSSIIWSQSQGLVSAMHSTGHNYKLHKTSTRRVIEQWSRSQFWTPSTTATWPGSMEGCWKTRRVASGVFDAHVDPCSFADLSSAEHSPHDFDSF